MKSRFIFLLFCLSILLTSCSMEATIPENQSTFSIYFDHNDLFDQCVDVLDENGYDCMISRSDYYSVQGSEDIAGMYLQNMSDQSVVAFENETVQMLFDRCGVKLIDLVYKNGITVCSFDLCIPGRNFDYGIYYVSEDSPIYLGDITYQLQEKNNGYVYEQKSSFGTSFTYYTEKITNHYYYYEIS